jgi:uncharacterized protein YjbJ (UPF0337 family)
MNWDQVKGRWKQLEGSAREKWGDLTNDEFDQIQGDRQILVGKLQERYGITKEEAERRADDWAGTV